MRGRVRLYFVGVVVLFLGAPVHPEVNDVASKDHPATPPPRLAGIDRPAIEVRDPDSYAPVDHDVTGSIASAARMPQVPEPFPKSTSMSS